MKLSRRITTLSPGGTNGWEVYRAGQKLKRQGVKLTDLSIGQHDIGTDPAILKAMYEAAAGGHTGYAAIDGIPPLRETIAARVEARTGVPTRPENVVVTGGGQGALFATHFAALEPGDRALYVEPCYATYAGTIRACGGVPVAIPALPENDFLPTRAQIDAAAADGAASLIVNSPNNPTGVVYPRACLEEVAEAAQAHDMWLISDEVYDTQVWEGEHVSPRALPGLAERTLVIGSMSKSHAMTGSRVGWVVGPEEAIAALAELALNTTYGIPGFIQDAALAALQMGEDLERRVAAPFARRRELIAPLLAAQNLVRALPNGGAMYVMLDIRATGMTGQDFAWALLEEERIVVMPGESFGPAAAGHIRLALTVEDEALVEAVGRLLAFAAARARETV